MIDANAAIAAMSNSSPPERLWIAASMMSGLSMRALVRRRQAAHGELDAAVGQFAPAFDFGHVGGLGETTENLARLVARFLARQREGLAAERVCARRAFAQRLRGPRGEIGGGSLFAP